MAPWSYMVTDLRTRTIVDQACPFTEVSFDEGLRGTGGFRGKFPTGRPSWSDRLSDDGMRRVVWPMRFGRPVGAFVFTAGSPVDPWRSPVQPIECQHLASIFARRVISHTLTFNQVDQNNILRDLVRYSLGQSTQYTTPTLGTGFVPAAIPWITLDTNLSGILRDRKETEGNTDDGYPASARKNVATCMSQVADLVDGVEWRWVYGLDTDGYPYMKLDTGGPGNYHRVGRPPGALPPLVFEHPSRTVLSAVYGFDSTKIVSHAHVLGQQREDNQPIGEGTLGWLYDAGYPLLESVFSESSVQSQDVLTGKAQGKVAASDDAWALTLDGQSEPAFTTYGLGDVVTLRVRRQDGKQLPDRADQRITGWSVRVDDSGASEVVTPTLEMA